MRIRKPALVSGVARSTTPTFVPLLLLLLLLAATTGLLAEAQAPSDRELFLGVSGDANRMVSWTSLEGTLTTPIEPTTCDTTSSCSPPQAAATGGASFLTLEYAYDAEASALILLLTGKFENNIPGWVGLGFRQGLSSSTMMSARYSTMGPADYILNYDLPTSGLGCALPMHLNGATNVIPAVSQGSNRGWDLFEPTVRSFALNGTLKAQYVISPIATELAASLLAYKNATPTTTTSSSGGGGSPSAAGALPTATLQLQVAMGNKAKIGASGQGECGSGGKHDVLRVMTELTLPQHNITGFNPASDAPFYSLPMWSNGCHYGVANPTVFANDTTGAARCSDPCFYGFQGPNCTEKCSCPHGTCPNLISSAVGDCASCDSGYYGSQCTACSCVTAHTTSCVDGLNGNGFCVCKAPWAGTSCDECDATHFGPSCSQTCTCQNRGVCNNSPRASAMADGTCSSCASGFYGVNCESTCAACTSGFVCSDGPSGNGTCITAPVTPAPVTPMPVVQIALIQCVTSWTASTLSQTNFISTVASAVNVHSSEVSIVSVVSSTTDSSLIVQFKFVNMDTATIQSKYTYFLQLAARSDTSITELKLKSATGITQSQITAAPTTGSPPTPPPTTTVAQATTAATTTNIFGSGNGNSATGSGGASPHSSSGRWLVNVILFTTVILVEITTGIQH